MIPPPKVPYDKPPLRFSKQVEQLAERGLTISDPIAAEQFLTHINYYRLSAYYRPYCVSKDKFSDAATFEMIKSLYEFDSDLRALIAEALMPIEISIRTNVAYHMAHQYGPFGHEDPNTYWPRFVTPVKTAAKPNPYSYADLIEDLRAQTRRSDHETFVQHFSGKYAEYPKLPVWTAVELMSFGTLSKMFGGLQLKDKIAIANKYQIEATVLQSWLRTLNYIRNICAHHSRLWNKELANSAALPPVPEWRVLPKRVALILFILNALAKRAPLYDVADWRARVAALMQRDCGVAAFHHAMGLNENWANSPLWR